MNMEKEEFIAAKKKIESDIFELVGLKKKLERDYIEAHKKFDIGQKVIIRGNRFAFVRDISIGFNNDLLYSFYKAKNDGTQSKHSDYCGDNTQIEPVIID